ncbi:hypothetical protein J4Q44_G00014290 [Coregonus suidteri]|uniref:Uncharacterized protein n=1 Tax=Coregonus suidteri TaxID=861788 RepID=A0AAN8R8P6_9TELE
MAESTDTTIDSQDTHKDLPSHSCSVDDILTTALTTVTSRQKRYLPAYPEVSPCGCAWSSPQTGRAGWHSGAGRGPVGDVVLQPKLGIEGTLKEHRGDIRRVKALLRLLWCV